MVHIFVRLVFVVIVLLLDVVLEKSRDIGEGESNEGLMLDRGHGEDGRG